jgi:hypothetical protein
MFALCSRIRGYHSDRLKLPGFATGVIESYYYALPENKLKMKEYWPVSLEALFLFSTSYLFLLSLCNSFPTSGVRSFLRPRIPC